ncbi:MAG: hypothetical protein ABJC66_09040 [Gammaproteobacteria bacterium]
MASLQRRVESKDALKGIPLATTLWAWVSKLRFLKWDHTWITTDDNRVAARPTTIGQVITAGEDYWYCWGDFHKDGITPAHPDGSIGSRLGDLALARCICQSNLDSRGNPPAQGTIFSYGIDGVCHQLANQVLWATQGTGASPLTVRLARGYGTSTFFFGSYGRQVAAWRRRLASCPAAGVGGGGSGSPFMSTSDPPDLHGDEFENTARAVLNDDSHLLRALLSLREEASLRNSQFHELADETKGRTPTAIELNAAYNQFCARAAKLLGDKKFEQIFGVPAGVDVDIVDREFLENSRRPPPGTRGL